MVETLREDEGDHKVGGGEGADALDQLLHAPGHNVVLAIGPWRTGTRLGETYEDHACAYRRRCPSRRSWMSENGSPRVAADRRRAPPGGRRMPAA